jgi:hypothetical protein
MDRRQSRKEVHGATGRPVDFLPSTVVPFSFSLDSF